MGHSPRWKCFSLEVTASQQLETFNILIVGYFFVSCALKTLFFSCGMEINTSFNFFPSNSYKIKTKA